MSAQRPSEGRSLGELLGDSGLQEIALSADVAELCISGLQLDSRKLEHGDLFLAFPGLQADGRDYLSQAQAAGAVAVLVEMEDFLPIDGVHIPVIAVAQLAQKVSAVAGAFYGRPSDTIDVIGVTGTNGKTTCSQLLAQLLTLLGRPAGVIGTLGYVVVGKETVTSSQTFISTGLTTPDAVNVQRILASLAAQGAKAVAMEVSSHSLDQGRVAAVKFSTAVFTNLSHDHLDYHQSMARYQQAKARLFASAGLRNAIVNIDDEAGRDIAGQLSATDKTCALKSLSQANCYTYSCAQVAADIYAQNQEFTQQGMRAHIVTPWGQGELASQLQGGFNLSNLLAVIGAACAEGHALAAVLAAVAQLKSVPGRLQVVDPEVLPLVVVDYAHTSDALEKALLALKPACQGRLWCVFGCGGDRDQSKRSVMGEVASRFADRLVVTSDNPRSEDAQSIIKDVLAGIPSSEVNSEDGAGGLKVIEDRGAAIAFAIAHADDRDVVLIAGKGHEDYQLVKGHRLPFNDVVEARLALRKREAL